MLHCPLIFAVIAQSEKLLTEQLKVWQSNHAKLEQLFKESKAVAEVSEHSLNLSKLAAAALEAMETRKNGSSLSEAWVKEKTNLLQEAKKVRSSTEIGVLQELEGLIKGKLEAEPKAYSLF